MYYTIGWQIKPLLIDLLLFNSQMRRILRLLPPCSVCQVTCCLKPYNSLAWVWFFHLSRAFKSILLTDEWVSESECRPRVRSLKAPIQPILPSHLIHPYGKNIKISNTIHYLIHLFKQKYIVQIFHKGKEQTLGVNLLFKHMYTPFSLSSVHLSANPFVHVNRCCLVNKLGPICNSKWFFPLPWKTRTIIIHRSEDFIFRV